MCDHANREEAMTVVHRNGHGTPTVWCDPCLAPLVTALNDGGIATVASCCGHGRRPGTVALMDGRELLIADDHDQARRLDALLDNREEDDMNEPNNWRALADALQYAMTETGVEPTQDYVQATAKDALAWLEQREYRLLSRPGGVQAGRTETP